MRLRLLTMTRQSDWIQSITLAMQIGAMKKNKLGQYESAIPDFDKAVQLKPDNAHATTDGAMHAKNLDNKRRLLPIMRQLLLA